MREFIEQTKWQFILLARNNIILISIAVTAFYSVIFFAFKDTGTTDEILTVLILNDPAVIGLFFIGISIILERNQNVLNALFVTPSNLHVYLLSRIVALSVIALICSLGMAIAAIGFTFNLIHFSIGVMGISMMACMSGIYLVCFTNDFMSFILRSIPILIVFLNLPLLNYFEITDSILIKITPVSGSLDLIINSYGNPSRTDVITGYISIIVWLPLLHLLVYRRFNKTLVKS